MDPRVEKRARSIRRAGYILFGGTGLFIVVCVSIGVIHGLSDGLARDPFTGRPADQESAQCVALADGLSAELDELPDTHVDESEASHSWWTRYLAWKRRCDRIHDDTVEVLLEKGESRYGHAER